MGTARFILALDAGTTSSRTLIFDGRARIVAQAQREFTQYFPQPGWVEHDAQEIWDTQRATMIDALRAAKRVRRAALRVGDDAIVADKARTHFGMPQSRLAYAASLGEPLYPAPARDMSS